MPFDAPAAALAAKEVNSRLPVKVDRIYQLFPDEFLFSCFGKGESMKLLFSLNPQYLCFHLDDRFQENLGNPTAFGLLLRKHFNGAKLTVCKVIPFERIIKLDFETYDQQSHKLSRKILWLELTGKTANLIITDENGVIIDSWRKTSSSKPDQREIEAGLKYELPPTNGRWQPVTISRSQFKALISQVPDPTPLEKFFLKHWYGLSGLAINECSRRAGLEPLRSCAVLSDEAIDQLYNSFTDWAGVLENEIFTPTCLYDPEGFPVDFAAFPIRFPPEKTIAKTVSNFNEAVADVLDRRNQAHRFQEAQRSLLRKIQVHLEKNRTKMAKQQVEAREAEEGDHYRIAGELLTTYGYQISKGCIEAKLVNHYDPEGKIMVIPLNPARTAQENAQVYFKKYQKAKKGQLAIARQIKKTGEAVEYLESLETLVQNSATFTDLRLVLEEWEGEEKAGSPVKNPSKKSLKKAPPAEPRLFQTPAGHQILVGRNNLQNDRLTFKIADPGDLWFHTQKIPGSHVILKPQSGIPVDDQSLNYACQLAVYFSKAKESTKVPVDYTPRKNVKKPPGSKPGFVIYDFFKTAIITPDLQLLKELGVL